MSNADCEYPNPCGCGCQDEPTRTGCKCCGREDRHTNDCLIPENARLRASIAELEKERNAALLTADCAKSERDLAWQHCQRAREERDAQLVKQTIDDIAEIIDADGAQKARSESLAAERDSERARAEKAEAERDWIAKSRDTHLERAVEMETQRNALRAERDRYLAAIVEWVEAQNETVGDPSPKAWSRRNDAHLALCRIAEEKA